jgi:hypothetical protein
MKISKPHQLFADYLGNQRALSNPEEFLGPNWKDVLNFWFFIDTLSLVQFEIAWGHYRNLDEANRVSAHNLAWNASCCVTSIFITTQVFSATHDSHPGFGPPTIELIASHKILEQGKPLTFVPLFLNL